MAEKMKRIRLVPTTAGMTTHGMNDNTVVSDLLAELDVIYDGKTK
jgi:hypothetical protein